MLKSSTEGDARAARGYRPEIDGLRSIAVLTVILFHYGTPGFSGGFIGVDIFFVISGFLIGSILWHELQTTDRIDLIGFYSKRFRRIAPAFSAMALVTSLFASAILLPFDLREFGKELLSSSTYTSNIYFYLNAGYFDTAAEQKLFLHTWSLSVEEQFYIVLPLFLLIAIRFTRSISTLLAAVAVISFLLCLLATARAPDAAFYLFPFRAWELLAGVSLGIWALNNSWHFAIHRAVSWVGLILIGLAVALIEPGHGFPGLWALLPVAGAVLIIANGRNQNAVNAVLASQLAVFIGLLSYSLYLWHWPILVLTRYYVGDHLSGATLAACLIATFVASWLSWKYVEMPFRRRKLTRSFNVIAAGCATSVVGATLGALFYVQNGLPGRFSKDVAGHIGASQDFLQDWRRCRIETQGPLKTIETCRLGPEGQEPRVLVWGDSHVRGFKEGLALAADEAGVPGLLVWTAGCPPVIGITKKESSATPAQDARCSQINARIVQALPNVPSVVSVLLIGRWNYYVEGRGVGLDQHNTISIRSSLPTEAVEDPASAMEDALKHTIQEMASSGIRTFLLQQTPEIANYDSRVFAKRLAHGIALDGGANKLSATLARNQAEARSARSRALISRIARETDLVVLDPWPDLCDTERCSAIKNGQPIYFDNNHLTNTGARALRHLFAPALNR